MSTLFQNGTENLRHLRRVELHPLRQAAGLSLGSQPHPVKALWRIEIGRIVAILRVLKAVFGLRQHARSFLIVRRNTRLP